MSMNRNTTLIALTAVVVIAIGGFWWFTSRPQETSQIQQKGSDTLLVLAQNWAETYMAQEKNIEIVVSGGGSGTGISALINNQIDIADASRQIKQKEIDAANEGNVNPVEWKVALDGISLIVNINNPLNEISYDQLRQIYNGSIENWAEVNGTPGVVTRKSWTRTTTEPISSSWLVTRRS
jgi:phosphate transport system substrate-binding protein